MNWLGRVRVHELAKELERSSLEVIKRLSELLIPWSTSLSTVSQEEANRVRKSFGRPAVPVLRPYRREWEPRGRTAAYGRADWDRGVLYSVMKPLITYELSEYQKRRNYLLGLVADIELRVRTLLTSVEHDEEEYDRNGYGNFLGLPGLYLSAVRQGLASGYYKRIIDDMWAVRLLVTHPQPPDGHQERH